MVFQIVTDAPNDTRDFPPILSSNRAVLDDPRARVVEASASGVVTAPPPHRSVQWLAEGQE